MEKIIFLYYKILSWSEDWFLYLFENRGKILIVPEEGLFGRTPLKRTFYVVSVSAFIFIFKFVYLKPIRSLLIQRIPAELLFRLLA